MYSYASKGNGYFNPSTGVGDSVLIAYDDLRIVNVKLTELKYNNEKINKLNAIIVNDSIIRSSLENEIKFINKNTKKLEAKNKVLFGATIAATVAFIISLFKK